MFMKHIVVREPSFFLSIHVLQKLIIVASIEVHYMNRVKTTTFKIEYVKIIRE